MVNYQFERRTKAFHFFWQYIIINLGKTEIDVPYLPYKEYIHGEGNFADEYYGQIYKIAYNLNYDIKFNFMSYDTWKYQLKN